MPCRAASVLLATIARCHQQRLLFQSSIQRASGPDDTIPAFDFLFSRPRVTHSRSSRLFHSITNLTAQKSCSRRASATASVQNKVLSSGGAFALLLRLRKSNFAFSCNTLFSFDMAGHGIPLSHLTRVTPFFTFFIFWTKTLEKGEICFIVLSGDPLFTAFISYLLGERAGRAECESRLPRTVSCQTWLGGEEVLGCLGGVVPICTRSNQTDIFRPDT